VASEPNIYAADAQAMRYSTAAVVIHWLTAALLAGQLVVGFVFHEMDRGPARSELFMWHKTLGVTILVLALLRLAVRLMRRPPPFPADYPKLQASVAKWIHRLLYLMLILLPLTGLAAASWRGPEVELLGGLTIPSIPGVTEDAHEVFEEVHEVLVWTTIAMLAGHVLAALWHQFVDRGPIAGRMWPFRSTRSV
jgi:cytochrome b561